jgi:hypothetical protein
MNKTRFLGITLLLIGIIIMYKIDNDLYSFIGGLLIGIGIGTIISGKTIFSRKEAE